MGTRCIYSLDGPWSFWKDPDSSFTPASLETGISSQISVPAPWQSQADDLRSYSGTAWYQKQFIVDKTYPLESSFLVFHAVNHKAEIWLNGVVCGQHEGGYLPFELEVTGALQPGMNTLTVRVTDPSELFPEIPHGKQSWYGRLSGIWQSVYLESRPACHISSLKITPYPENGKLQCKVFLSQPAPRNAVLRCATILPSDARIEAKEFKPSAENNNFLIEWQISDPQKWSIDQPNLYKVEVELVLDNVVNDFQEKTFGFRTIQTRDGKILLNEEPVYLRGALDQDYYPNTICTPPSREFVEDEMRKAKLLGLNCLRIHIKIPDPVYYEVADRLGLLIWTEMPNWITFTALSDEMARKTYEGILERDGHHPSIIAWTIINEGWGLDLVNDANHRKWLKEMFTWLKAKDPTRLVVDNSPCQPNFHMQSDLADYHHYNGMPDHQKQWQAFVKEYADRPDWINSQHGDAVSTGNEPLIVSEFGNWGLPDADQLASANHGLDPWWFDSGLSWGDAVVYPHGVRERFKELGLDRVFGSWHNFIEETQWHQYNAMKYEIETMRLFPQISGYIITELTDVHWECNGLMDMNRNRKVYNQRFPEINADTVIIPQITQNALWSDTPIAINIFLAHGAVTLPEGLSLHWKAKTWNREGKLQVPPTISGEVISIGVVTLPPLENNLAICTMLEFELHSNQDKILQKNSIELSIYPKISPEKIPAGPIWSPEPELLNLFKKSGYAITKDPSTAQLIVASKMTGDLLSLLWNGARILLLAENPECLKPGMLGLSIVPRAGTLWSGDWASSFGWLSRQENFKNLPGRILLDSTFEPVIPEFNIVGLRDWDFQNFVHSGQFVGWIHKPAAWIGERKYGKGHLVISTFRLGQACLDNNPLALNLMHSLVNLLLNDFHQEVF
jgi:hypothetical protein